MATLAEVKAALAVVEEKEADYLAKQKQLESDTAAETAAIETTNASRSARNESLRALHEADDAYDAISSTYEPPELPATT